MNNSILKTLEERPLRMVAERELPRPQIIVRRAAPPASKSDNPVSAFLILALAFSLVYAVMRSMPV